MKKKLFIFIILIFLVVGAILFYFSKSSYAHISENTLYVGYGKISIDPTESQTPIPLRGYGGANRTGVVVGDPYHQELFATAISFTDSKKNVVVLTTVDLLGVDANLVQTVRNNVSNSEVVKNKNINNINIMISATHTHSAPFNAVGSLTGTNKEVVSNYRESLINNITNAIILSLDDVKPAKLLAGKIDVGANSLNFIRHYYDTTISPSQKIAVGDNHNTYFHSFDKDGNHIWLTPQRNEHISTADSTLQVIKLDFIDETTEDILLINWQAHPTITGGITLPNISSDFISGLREHYIKEGIRVAYYSGAGGNVNWNTLLSSEIKEDEAGVQYNYNDYKYDEKAQQDRYAKSNAYAKKLVEKIDIIINNLTEIEVKNVAVKSKILDISYDPNDTPTLLRNARYINKLYVESKANLKKLILGTYEFVDNYQFPVYIDANGNTIEYDSSGKELRKVILNSQELKNALNLECDEDNTICSCDVTNFNADLQRKLATYVGTSLNEIIYSPYHARDVVARYDFVNNVPRTISINVELDAISLGNVSFATAPVEMFNETGMDIKNTSPTDITFVLATTNDYLGYLPSQEAFNYGSYETDTTRFQYGDAERIASEITNMLNDVHDESNYENKYTITFDSAGGSSVSNQIVTENEHVTEPENPTRNNYKFVEWQLDGKTYDFNAPVVSNITLVALWQKSTGTITYNSATESNQVTVQTITFDTNTKLDKNTFTRTGYNFKEWNTKADGTGTVYSDEQIVNVTSDLVLYAMWQESFDYRIDKYNIDNTNNYISDITINTDVDTFKQNIETNSNYSISVDYKTINGIKILYTGGKTRIYNTGTLYAEYTNVVIGDINGDGKINSGDLLNIRQHLLRINTISGAYFLASDINHDDKINSGDLLNVRRHLLGIKLIQ